MFNWGFGIGLLVGCVCGMFCMGAFVAVGYWLKGQVK